MVEDKEKYLVLERVITLMRWLFITVTLFSLPATIYENEGQFNKTFLVLIIYGIWNGLVYVLINNFNDTEKKRYWVGIIEWVVDLIAIGIIIILFKMPVIGYGVYISLVVYTFIRYLASTTAIVLSMITIVNMILSHVFVWGWDPIIHNEQVGNAIVSIFGVAISVYIFSKEYARLKMLINVHHTDVRGLQNNIKKLADLSEITIQLQRSNTYETIIRNSLFTIADIMKKSNILLILYGDEGDMKLYQYEAVKQAVTKGEEILPFQLVYIKQELEDLRKMREYKNCIRCHEPLQFSSIACNERLKEIVYNGVDTKYVYIFPMMQYNKESGMIVCTTAERIDELICQYIAAVVEQVGTAFTRTVRLANEKKKAIYDALTGAKSRLGMIEEIPNLRVLSSKYNHDIGCIFVDIDYFKLFNDDYGHSTGDEALKIVASIIKNSIRKEDMVARYGGEEFVILLYNVTEEETYQKAETIRKNIEECNLKAMLEIDKKLTASFGIAIYPRDARDFDEVIRLADEAMYKAKEVRNKVCIYSKDI